MIEYVVVTLHCGREVRQPDRGRSRHGRSRSWWRSRVRRWRGPDTTGAPSTVETAGTASTTPSGRRRPRTAARSSWTCPPSALRHGCLPRGATHRGLLPALAPEECCAGATHRRRLRVLRLDRHHTGPQVNADAPPALPPPAKLTHRFVVPQVTDLPDANSNETERQRRRSTGTVRGSAGAPADQA